MRSSQTQPLGIIDKIALSIVSSPIILMEPLLAPLFHLNQPIKYTAKTCSGSVENGIVVEMSLRDVVGDSHCKWFLGFSFNSRKWLGSLPGEFLKTNRNTLPPAWEFVTTARSLSK
jgi:hypothetical protein